MILNEMASSKVYALYDTGDGKYKDKTKQNKKAHKTTYSFMLFYVVYELKERPNANNMKQ